jgi:hypothetical protein
MNKSKTTFYLKIEFLDPNIANNEMHVTDIKKRVEEVIMDTDIDIKVVSTTTSSSS